MYPTTKKIWVKALIGILLVWSIITVYFYFQHRVSVTVINVPGWELDVKNNEIMQIKQIRIYDWEEKEWRQTFWDRNRLILELGNNLPTRALRNSYYLITSRILYYYFDPYEKLNDSRRIEVSGVYLSESESNDYRPWIQVLVNGKTLIGERARESYRRGYNMEFFTEEGMVYLDRTIDTIELNYTLDYKIMSDNDLKSKSFNMSEGHKKTYNFFNRAPSKYDFIINLSTLARQFITKLEDEKHQAKSMLSNKVKNFAWDNVNWIEKQKAGLEINCTAINHLGDYKNFSNVFGVDLEYKFGDKENIDQDRNVDATQKVYFIEGEGEWKVIDVSPLSQTN